MSTSQKIIIILILSFLVQKSANATHNRAGEITYKYIGGYTFEFTITTYTYVKSKANRDALYVAWGDDTYQEVPIQLPRIILPNDYYFNTYVTQHTFPGPGTYQILMEDPNRNLGVKNIPNSVNTIFSIQTTMLIGPFVGTNSTPVLLNPPIDKAAKNHLFIHNPVAYDSDGDSISYELTICTAERGNPIEGYVLPPASDTLYIDGVTGDLTWDTPVDTGVYNIAMYIDEWRDNVRIGRITRDMQIDVYNTDNNPPINGPINNYCVEAGDTIEFLITTTDADNDLIKQYMIGAPMNDSSATFELIEAGAGFSTSKFTWIPDCSYARNQPIVMVLKSEDVVNEISLVDITSFSIRVLPNAPKNLQTDPKTDQVVLQWDVTSCGNPVGYQIYRRINPFGFSADSCENGVPSYTGYKLIDRVLGSTNNTYTDDNNGQGLVPGFDYCYMITAVYSDGVESFASEEACTSLIPGLPSMLEVSVLSDDSKLGEISVKWAVPKDFDTIDDGPYRYEVYRSAPNETDYSLLATIPTVDLTDTAFIDQNINTLVFPYFYSVRLTYQDDDNEWITHPGYETASSLYLELVGNDNNISIDMQKRAPWFNNSFDIYRTPEGIDEFQLIANSSSSTYIDTGLANLVPYTYRVLSTGTRPLNGLSYTTSNISHINSTSAFDSTPPCMPETQVISICDSSYNILTWTSPESLCGDDDVLSYQVYYKPTQEGNLNLIATILPPDTTFIHREGIESLAAIYGVIAVDSFNNASDMSIVAIDSCVIYSLPNVFSPNGDGINDKYISWNLGGFVKEVDMNIFNRYGQTVYKTTDPDINWDGKHKDNGKLVSTGVYYYVCDFFEPRLTGNIRRTLKGFIHVYSGDDNPQPQE